MVNYRTLGADFSAGLRAPHYVNGRLLTAEDLQQEQQTQLERLAHTGRAAGYGIVEGFVVAAAANKTALQITAGIGLNRQGYVVHLAAEQVTLLVQPAAPDGTPVRRSGRFAACVDDGGEQPASTADGAYLLTAAPLAQLQGFAPRQACDGTATSTCANQWEVEGVEFKIIRLANYSSPTGNRAGRNRNLLAHWFYGSDALVTLMRDPFQFDAAYSGFDELPAADFTLCDLPLAVFYWADGQIAFVDQWAVRRRIMHAYPAAAWAANLSDQRRAEGEARFLQFQEQIAEVQAASGAATDAVRAVDRFAYLPPVGMLPVNPFALIVADVFEAALSERQQGQMRELGLTVAQVLARVRAGVLDTLGSRAVFNLEQFFGEFLPPAYSIVHEDLVHDRLHQSWVQPPIALPPPSTQGGLFDLTLADGTLVAVNDNNFGGILDNLSRRFAGTVFSHAAAATAAPPGGAAPASAIDLNPRRDQPRLPAAAGDLQPAARQRQ